LKDCCTRQDSDNVLNLKYVDISELYLLQ